MSESSIKILLIEDDEDDYILAKEILSDVDGQQYDLTWHADADEGLAALLTGRFDACLVDYRIGERTGLELIKEANTRQCNTPLVLLTGVGDHDTDMAAAEAGATDYLEKVSLTPALLERAIRYSISQARNRQALLDQSILLKLTLDNTGAGIATFNARMELVAWNERFLEMIGVPTPDVSMMELFLQSPLGKSIASILASEDPDKVHCFEHTAANQRIHEIRINPLPAGGGVTVCIDITERKNHEVRLQAAKEQAEVAARAKSTFLATVSHELRTPLNAVIGFSDLMMSAAAGPLAPEYVEYSRDINTSGRQLLDLINDLLDISRIEAGKYEMKESQVDVRELVENCVRRIREQAASGSLTVKVETPPEPLALFGDERLIRQVLANLLSNAVKFTNPGGVVRVGLTLGAEEPGALGLYVEDTGIGIAPSDIGKVFTPFGQVDANLSRKYNGTGLGLALVKAVAELHDGSVRLQSEVGKGTRITVTFPMDRVRQAEPALERSVA